MKCYLSLDCRNRRGVDLAFFASYPNEHAALDSIRRRLPSWRLGEITIGKRNLLRLDALKALPAFAAVSLRSLRVATMLARRLHFMPACRVFSTLAYYARCRRLMADNEAKAVVIANHYSPECLALAAAAHEAGKKVIFTNHANAARDTGYLPPLHSDLAALTSQALLDSFMQRGRRNINAVFVPVHAPQRPLRLPVDPAKPATIGIFLTALTDMARLRELVDELTRRSDVASVLVRPHPVAVVGEDLSSLCHPDGPVRDMMGTPLFENIEQCDIAVCGNSTVVIEILRGGVPVLYDDRLDRISSDFNGYVRRGLIASLPAAWDGSVAARLNEFYGSAAWPETMRYFDAGYGQDEDAMYRNLDTAVGGVIR